MQEAEQRWKDKGKDLLQQIQIIYTISGGPTLARISNNARKNHSRKIPRLTASYDILQVSKGPQNPPCATQIIFTEEDVHNMVQPHDNPMVITIQIANCLVHRVLIDTRSSVDIIFKGAHDKLNLKNPCYNSCITPLYGFTGDSLMPVASHRLLVIIDESPLQLNLMTQFVIVDTSSTYNAILGRPFLAEIRGVLSIYHNVLKFPVGTKVGYVKGDQQVACNCYVVSTNPTVLAKQCAQVTSEPSQEVLGWDHNVLEE